MERHSFAMHAAPLALLLLAAGQTPAGLGPTLEVELRVAGDPQVAIWLETEAGEFVDTLMVTRLVGTFGLGNRPGRGDFGGGYLWPYGRREMALPVWAHRRGAQYDRLVFQDCREHSLGWHEIDSSSEPFYCRPLTEVEMSVDAITCPTTNFSTDKGVPLRLIDPSANSDCRGLVASQPVFTPYPPRNDINLKEEARDWAGVLELRLMNDLDAVSRATPRAGDVYRLAHTLPAAMSEGAYVVWVEVNQEFDTNAHHSYGYFEDPALTDYGIPHVGQPSVLWRLPITISATAASAQARDYAGYGSPDGLDGDVRLPDETITTGVPGSGAERLLLMSNARGEHRVHIAYRTEVGCELPVTVEELRLVRTNWAFVQLAFDASLAEDDRVAQYEVRYKEGREAITSDDDFMAALPGPDIGRGAPGKQIVFQIDMPRPETTYTVAIRSFNRCGEPSPFTTLSVTTETREFATVDACFIATAAYGSMDDAEVVTLRRFRDRALMPSALGRAFVRAYYRASPALADLIRERAFLRAAVRTALAPVVWLVRASE